MRNKNKYTFILCTHTNIIDKINVREKIVEFVSNWRLSIHYYIFNEKCYSIFKIHFVILLVNSWISAVMTTKCQLGNINGYIFD